MPLFAEAFLVPLTEPPGRGPAWHYDERLGLNVLANGLPFVETGNVAPTETLTEVRAEQDDFDRADEDRAVGAGIETKVRRESDDFASVNFGTETRRAPGEQDDFARGDAMLGTETAIGGEADDFERSYPNCRAASTWNGDAKTLVRGEADDFAAEQAEPAEDSISQG